MFYMHLKYDSRLFRALFTGPLIIAVITLISLLFLFGHIAIRLAS
jgi:cytochrome c oxidase subunit 4